MYDRTAFTIIQQPPSVLNSSESGEVVILFDPITAGRKRVVVQINSNDYINPVYVFEVMGYGTIVGDPVEEVEGDSTNEDGYGTVPLVLGLFFAASGVGVVCSTMQSMARTKIKAPRSKVGDNPFLATNTDGIYNGDTGDGGDDYDDGEGVHDNLL